MLRETRIVAVGVEAQGRSPLVLLQELDRQDRMLPIWIGLPEAAAMANEWRGLPSPRPTTHRLLATLIEEFGRRVEQVRIVALHGSVFHAELVFDAATTVSARPSDAIALALHLSVPVLVDDAVLDEAAVPADRVSTAEVGGPAEDDEIAQFRHFLQDVDPEDFDSS